MATANPPRRMPPEFEHMPNSKIELAARISAQRERLIAQRRLHVLEKSGVTQRGKTPAAEKPGASPVSQWMQVISAVVSPVSSGKPGGSERTFPRSQTMQWGLAHPALAAGIFGLTMTMAWPLVRRVGARRLLRWFGWTIPALAARVVGSRR